MKASRLTRLGLAAVALASAGYGIWTVLGTSRPSHAESPRSGLEFEPNEEQRQRLQSLRASLDESNPHFSNEDARQKSNAKLFTYMAATSEEPQVIQAALEAIQSAYSARSERKEIPDADLDKVLLKYMQSETPSIAAAAFAAVRIPLLTDEPRIDLMAAVARMAGPNESPARRYAALEALNLIRPNRRSQEVLAAFTSALEAEQSHLVSAALSGLTLSGPTLNDDGSQLEGLGSRVLALTDHGDPGVRGNAIALLAEIPGLVEAPIRLGKAREHLKDSHAFPRAEAIDCLERSRDVSAIHRLIGLVEDLGIARYDLVGWTGLDGTPGRIVHALPGRRLVAEAALYAIRSLSEIAAPSSGELGVGAQSSTEARKGRVLRELELTIGGPQQTDDLLKKNAEFVQDWYGRSREQIPSESAEMAEPSVTR